MNITELIASIGPENIQVQNIMASSPQMTQSTKSGEGTIRFYTSAANASALINESIGFDQTRVGLVLWFDSDKLGKESA